jgi:hypothetical protein
MQQLFLYGRDGCHLCDEARTAIAQLLAERAAAGLPVPEVVERDIDTDPAWQRAFMASIPVVEIGGRRLELATNPRKVARLLSDALDAPEPVDAPLPARG